MQNVSFRIISGHQTWSAEIHFAHNIDVTKLRCLLRGQFAYDLACAAINDDLAATVRNTDG